MQTKPNSSAIILAAGASSRMGKPKALLDMGNKTLLEDQVDRLKRAGCSTIIVVVGSEANTIVEHHADLDVVWTTNSEWEKGYFSSILCGLSEVASSTLLLPIDTVGVPVETIKEILTKGLEENKNIIPTFKDRGGHPVFLTTVFIQKVVSTATLDDRLDYLLNENPDTLRFEVDSESILTNINTPDELSAYHHSRS